MSSSGDLVIDSLKFNGWDPESIFNVDVETNRVKPAEISDEMLMDLAMVGSLPFGGEFDQDESTENLSQSFPSSQVFYGANHKTFLQVNHAVISTAENDNNDEISFSPTDPKNKPSLIASKSESDIFVESSSNVAFVEDSDLVSEAVFTPTINDDKFSDSQACEITPLPNMEFNNDRNTMIEFSDEVAIEENTNSLYSPGTIESFKDADINNFNVIENILDMEVQDAEEDSSSSSNLTSHDVNTEDKQNDEAGVEVDILISTARNISHTPSPIESNISNDSEDQESLKEEIKENDLLVLHLNHTNDTTINDNDISDTGDAAIDAMDFENKRNDNDNNDFDSNNIVVVDDGDDNDNDTNNESGSIDDDSIAKWEILEEEKNDNDNDDTNSKMDGDENSYTATLINHHPPHPSSDTPSTYKHKVTFNDHSQWNIIEKGSGSGNGNGNGVVNKQLSLDSIDETEEQEDGEVDEEDNDMLSLPQPSPDNNITYNWSRGSAAVKIQRVARGHLGRRKYSRLLLREERAKLRGLQAKKQLQQQLMIKTAVSPKEVLPSSESDTIENVISKEKEKAEVLSVINLSPEEKVDVDVMIPIVSAAAVSARPSPVASVEEKSQSQAFNRLDAETDTDGSGGYHVTVVSVKDLRLKKSNGNQIPPNTIHNKERSFPTVTSTGSTSIPYLNADSNPVSRKPLPIIVPQESDKVTVISTYRPLSSIASRSSSGSQGGEVDSLEDGGGDEEEDSEVMEDSLDVIPNQSHKMVLSRQDDDDDDGDKRWPTITPPSDDIISLTTDIRKVPPIPVVPVSLGSLVTASDSTRTQKEFTEKEDVVAEVVRNKKEISHHVVKSTPPPLPVAKRVTPVIGVKDLQQAIGIQKNVTNINASEPITVITGAPGRKLPMLNARRQSAALCLQRVFRGHLGRKRWLERQEKLRQVNVYQCKNCGRVERGGAYCKGCGHRKATVKGITPAPAPAPTTASDGTNDDDDAVVQEERKKDRIRVVQKRNLGSAEIVPVVSPEDQNHIVQQQLPSSNKNNKGVDVVVATHQANPKSNINHRGFEKPPRSLQSENNVLGNPNGPRPPTISNRNQDGGGGQRERMVSAVKDEPTTERRHINNNYSNNEPVLAQATPPATRIPRPTQNPPPLPTTNATSSSYTASNKVDIPEDSPVRLTQGQAQPPRPFQQRVDDSQVVTDVPLDKKLLQDIKRNRSRSQPPQNNPIVPITVPPAPAAPVGEQLLPSRQRQPPIQDPQKYSKPTTSLQEDPPPQQRRHSNREKYTSATGNAAKASAVTGKPMELIEQNVSVAVASPLKLSLLPSPPVTVNPPTANSKGPPTVNIAPPPAGSYLTEYQRRRGGAPIVSYKQSDASALPPILPALALLSPRSQQSLQVVSELQPHHPLDSRRQKQTVARKSTNSAPPRLTVNESSNLPAAIRRSNDYLDAHAAAPLFPSKKNIASKRPRV